ncbi:MAG: T9SS type A sorting domain-containing protein [Bacteroidota bacterium]
MKTHHAKNILAVLRSILVAFVAGLSAQGVTAQTIQNVSVLSNTVPSMMSVRDVEAVDGRAYFSCGSGVAIMDSATRRILSYFGGEGNGFNYGSSIAVSGNRFYYTGSKTVNNQLYYGLFIVDMSNIANPVEVGHYYTAEGPCGLVVSGNYAYVAVSSAGLRIIDVSNPANPGEAGFYDTPGNANEVAVAGAYAYVADGSGGLRIVDISNPINPVEVGSFGTTGAIDVKVAGHYAFVADIAEGLKIIDISTPAAPVLAGTYGTSAVAVAVQDHYAYTLVGSSMRVVDFSNVAAPAEVARFDYPNGNGNAKVAVDGSYVITADETGGSYTIDISNPTIPSNAHFYFPPDRETNVAVSGNYAYTTHDGHSLRIVDVSNPLAPAEVGFLYDLLVDFRSVAVDGHYAYVAGGSAGLRIIDVADPTHPVESGSYDTPDFAGGVAVAGSIAYVADGYSGLRLVNISNPSAPTPVGYYNTPGNAVSVCIAGDLAYVADSDSGVQVINIANPSSPAFVGSFGSSCSTSDVTVSGTYAYLTEYKYFTSSGGLRVLDVSQPATPVSSTLVNSVPIAYRLAVAGSYAYVASNGGGFFMFDISNPSAPLQVATYDGDPAGGNGIAVSGGYIYLSQYASGLRIFRNLLTQAPPTLAYPYLNTNDLPTTLTMRWNGYTGATHYHLQVSADSLFSTIVVDDSTLADTTGYCASLAGSTVYFWRVSATTATGPTGWSLAWKFKTAVTLAVGNEQSIPREFSLEQNYPNPFNPTTVIRGQWTGDSRVKLTVYDMLGRVVATLADGRYPAGRYSFTFDGNGFPSGVYFYRLEAGGFVQTNKMLLIR